MTERKISEETWQERYDSSRGKFPSFSSATCEALATASMLDDQQARQIEQGAKIDKILMLMTVLAAPPMMFDPNVFLTGTAASMTTYDEASGKIIHRPIQPEELYKPTPDPRDAVVEAARKVDWNSVLVGMTGHWENERIMALRDALYALDREGV